MTPGLLAKLRFATTRIHSPLGRKKCSRLAYARRSLICGFAAFLMATVGLAIAIETVKPEWRDPEFGHRLAQLRQKPSEAPSRPVILILGTSRTQYGLDPRAMVEDDNSTAPRFYNFGESASPPLKVLLTLDRVLEARIRPAAIVVEVLPLWLAMGGSAEEQLGEQVSQFSARDLERLAPYATNADTLKTSWIRNEIKPWYTHRKVLLSHWLPRWLPWRERVDFLWQGMEADGFVPYPQNEPSETTRALAVACAEKEYRGAFSGFTRGETSTRILRDLVSRCRSQGIPLAFFIPPVSPEFRSWFKPGVWDSGDADLQLFGRELGVTVFPAPSDFTNSDFVDGHHLLRSPAERYSRWLANTSLRPWFMK